MKPKGTNLVSLTVAVAPHAGAWIETLKRKIRPVSVDVAPHAGAWIETLRSVDQRPKYPVAPHAGAWIETCTHGSMDKLVQRRPPRGGVD